jgi:hypothetical protein
VYLKYFDDYGYAFHVRIYWEWRVRLFFFFSLLPKSSGTVDRASPVSVPPIDFSGHHHVYFFFSLAFLLPMEKKKVIIMDDTLAYSQWPFLSLWPMGDG